MRRSSWVLVLALLGACNFKSSLSGGSTTPSGGTSTASTSSSSSDSSSSSTSGDPNERIPMIDLTGKTPEQATAALRAAGFSGEIEVNRHPLSCVDAKEVPGQINCQDPEPGKLAYKRHSVNVTVFERSHREGILLGEDLRKTVGMSIPDAKKYLKSLGHTGEVVVKENDIGFYQGCAADHVCSISHVSGAAVTDRITLTINKKNVDITMPD